MTTIAAEIDEKIRDLFREIDSDRSGSLSFPEIHTMMERLSGASVTLEQAQSVFRQMDKDSDGKISEEEFFVEMKNWYSTTRKTKRQEDSTETNKKIQLGEFVKQFVPNRIEDTLSRSDYPEFTLTNFNTFSFSSDYIASKRNEFISFCQEPQRAKDLPVIHASLNSLSNPEDVKKSVEILQRLSMFDEFCSSNDMNDLKGIIIELFQLFSQPSDSMAGVPSIVNMCCRLLLQSKDQTILLPTLKFLRSFSSGTRLLNANQWSHDQHLSKVYLDKANYMQYLCTLLQNIPFTKENESLLSSVVDSVCVHVQESEHSLRTWISFKELIIALFLRPESLSLPSVLSSLSGALSVFLGDSHSLSQEGLEALKLPEEQITPILTQMEAVLKPFFDPALERGSLNGDLLVTKRLLFNFSTLFRSLVVPTAPSTNAISVAFYLQSFLPYFVESDVALREILKLEPSSPLPRLSPLMSSHSLKLNSILLGSVYKCFNLLTSNNPDLASQLLANQTFIGSVQRHLDHYSLSDPPCPTISQIALKVVRNFFVSCYSHEAHGKRLMTLFSQRLFALLQSPILRDRAIEFFKFMMDHHFSSKFPLVFPLVRRGLVDCLFGLLSRFRHRTDSESSEDNETCIEYHFTFLKTALQTLIFLSGPLFRHQFDLKSYFVKDHVDLLDELFHSLLRELSEGRLVAPSDIEDVRFILGDDMILKLAMQMADIHSPVPSSPSSSFSISPRDSSPPGSPTSPTPSLSPRRRTLSFEPDNYFLTWVQTYRSSWVSQFEAACEFVPEPSEDSMDTDSSSRSFWTRLGNIKKSFPDVRIRLIPMRKTLEGASETIVPLQDIRNCILSRKYTLNDLKSFVSNLYEIGPVKFILPSTPFTQINDLEAYYTQYIRSEVASPTSPRDSSKKAKVRPPDLEIGFMRVGLSELVARPAESVDSQVIQLNLNPLTEKISPDFMNALFDYFRKNNTNEITFPQFKSFMETQGLTNDSLLAALFRSFDVDNSESLTLKELGLGLSSFMAGTYEQKCLAVFQAFDVDKSNTLDQAELQAMIMSTMDFPIETATNMVTAAFERIHSNNVHGGVVQGKMGDLPSINFDQFLYAIQHKYLVIGIDWNLPANLLNQPKPHKNQPNPHHHQQHHNQQYHQQQHPHSPKKGNQHWEGGGNRQRGESWGGQGGGGGGGGGHQKNYQQRHHPGSGNPFQTS